MMCAQHDLPEGVLVDWSRILIDLSNHGMTLDMISKACHIPGSTLSGYKNLDVEPKHADGQRLLALWWRCVAPELPTKKGDVRVRRVTKR